MKEWWFKNGPLTDEIISALWDGAEEYDGDLIVNESGVYVAPRYVTPGVGEAWFSDVDHDIDWTNVTSSPYPQRDGDGDEWSPPKEDWPRIGQESNTHNLKGDKRWKF